MIIDVHSHLGWDEVFDEDFAAQDLVDAQRLHGIDITIVQPSLVHDLKTVVKLHNDIAALCRAHPGRFYGMANPNPHLPGDEYERELRRCVQQLGFVGVKIHPLAHAVNPAGRHGRRVFALAEELGIPVMVHTGAGIPWAAPSLLAPLAEAHPGVKVVVAHAGGMILGGEAGQLAERCPNVYLECSWTGGFLVRHWVDQLGAQRVLFGSDHADNVATELAKFRSQGFSEEQLDALLGGTAAAIYGLPQNSGGQK
jgi:predicted TIM-barrel fold metal-dependent hydrolase